MIEIPVYNNFTLYGGAQIINLRPEYFQGTHQNPLPATGVAGQIICALPDSSASVPFLFYWNGTSWIKLGSESTGSLVLGTSPISVSYQNSAYTISVSAASATGSGVMSSTHYSLLANATDANTASTLVKRDANGAASFVKLTVSDDTGTYNIDGTARYVSVIPTLSGDVTNTGNIVTIGTGAVTDTKIASNAAISWSKIAASGSKGKLVITDSTTGLLTTSNWGINDTNLHLNDSRIVVLADPIADQDAVNFRTLKAWSSGNIDIHAPCLVASTGNVDLLSPNFIFDEITLTSSDAGERIFLKDQTDPKENGVYIFDGYGSLSRALEEDDGMEFFPGSTIMVREGNQWGRSGFTQVNIGSGNGGSVIIGTDNQKWVQSYIAGSVEAGYGLNKIGNTLHVVGTDNRIVSLVDGIDLAEINPTVTSTPTTSSTISEFTVDVYGRVTNVKFDSISIADSQLTGTVPITKGGTGTTTGSITGTGDVTLTSSTTAAKVSIKHPPQGYVYLQSNVAIGSTIFSPYSLLHLNSSSDGTESPGTSSSTLAISNSSNTFSTPSLFGPRSEICFYKGVQNSPASENRRLVTIGTELVSEDGESGATGKFFVASKPTNAATEQVVYFTVETDGKTIVHKGELDVGVLRSLSIYTAPNTGVSLKVSGTNATDTPGSGVLSLNSAGNDSIKFNNTSNSGKGGVAFYSGGSAPGRVAFLDREGKLSLGTSVDPVGTLMIDGGVSIGTNLITTEPPSNGLGIQGTVRVNSFGPFPTASGLARVDVEDHNGTSVFRGRLATSSSEGGSTVISYHGAVALSVFKASSDITEILSFGSSMTASNSFYLEDTTTYALGRKSTEFNLWAKSSSYHSSWTPASGDIVLQAGVGGFIGIGTSKISQAYLKIKSGSTTVAPISISGSLLTTPVAGSFETDNTSLYYTTSSNPTRKKLLYEDFSNTTLKVPLSSGGTGADLSTIGSPINGIVYKYNSDTLGVTAIPVGNNVPLLLNFDSAPVPANFSLPASLTNHSLVVAGSSALEMLTLHSTNSVLVGVATTSHPTWLASSTNSILVNDAGTLKFSSGLPFTLPITEGGTGAITATNARANLNVPNKKYVSIPNWGNDTEKIIEHNLGTAKLLVQTWVYDDVDTIPRLAHFGVQILNNNQIKLSVANASAVSSVTVCIVGLE